MGPNTGNLTNYRYLCFFLFIALLLPKAFAEVISTPDTPARHEIHQVTLDNGVQVSREIDVPSSFTNLTPLNATDFEIQRARRLVAEAITKVTKYNKARLAFPARNTYSFKSGSNEFAPTEDPPKLARRTMDSILLKETLPLFNETTEAPPLYAVPEEVRSAAALLAELEAKEQLTRKRDIKENDFRADQEDEQILKRQSGSWWMEGISHLGTQPFGKDASYKVFRNVKDYGAKGDGVTDDTAAINNAIADGNRCGAKCNGSTVKGAIVYFPAGTYLVSGTIEVFFNTQMIGNANNIPTIKAASSFVGLGIFSTDKYVLDGKGKQWYINTANFYRQIRNFKFDITQTNEGAYVCALHYQVAQATSLDNLEFIVSTNPNTTQQSIFAENGSGGYMSDLTFNGGAFGIYGGSQQFTATRLRFNNVRTSVQLIWDWGWTWQDIHITGSKTGFSLLSEDGVHHTGSIMIVDSVFENTETGILTFPPTRDIKSGTTGITLDNVKFINVPNRVVDTANKPYLNDDSVNTWALGPIYFSSKARDVALGASFPTYRNGKLAGSGGPLPKNPYFMRRKPQYENVPASSVVQMKNYAKGDGVTDDTAAFQSVMNQFVNTGKVIFIDAGSYILTDTITVPPGAKIVGECWAQLVATGSKFNDANNPRPLLRVGTTGSTGSMEIQDLLFTSKGETAGLVTVEWNINGNSLGSAAMWDSHVRLGGATGTGLTHVECPPSQNGTNSGCKAGQLMMHITKQASGYFENVWLWVADHTIDDPDMMDDNNIMPQCSIYVARGLLIESTEPVHLYGTSSEHSVFYQYTFYNAKNVLAAMIQTESPYYQPTPKPPVPFESNVGIFPGDPDYSSCGSGPGCDASWAVRVVDSSYITINGAGLYSWFQTYNQTCVDTMNCQQSVLQLQNNHGHVRICNLITVGTLNMIDADGTTVKAKDNLQVDFYPFWSEITVYDPVTAPPTKCKNGMSIPPDVSVPSGTQAAEDILTRDRYLTLINGTPYLWKMYGKHSYQMEIFNWPDIPAGESIQVHYIYKSRGIVSADSAGEVYYRMEGTSNTFVVKLSARGGENVKVVLDGMASHDHARGSVIGLGNISPGTNGWHFIVGLNWVITGNEEIGYWSGTNPSLEPWMSTFIDTLGERKLKHICMPGSHDAGMYKLNGKTPVATQQNTQTQILNIYDQLRRGSRYFDIRPVVGNGGQWLAGHYSNVLGVWQGANGESIDDMIADVNKFTLSNPELIILYLSHSLDTDNGYVDLSGNQWNALFSKLKGINHRYAGQNIDSATDLTELKLNDFIGGGQACVLVIADGAPDNTIVRNDGFFSTSNFPRYDSYSNSPVGQDMADDQVAKVHGNRNLVLATNDRKEVFHVLSWTLTPGVTEILFSSIEFLATFEAYNRLFWRGYPAFTPASYPNVIYMDFYSAYDQMMLRGWGYSQYYERTTLEVLTLALAVNLDLASANCYVADV